MKTKICRKCGLELPATTKYFYYNSGKYLAGMCKSCNKAKYGWSTKTVEQKQQHSIYTTKWSKKHNYKDQRKYAKNNPLKVKNRKRKTRDLLKQCYVAAILRIATSDLSPAILEAKRQQLLLYRLTKTILL